MPSSNTGPASNGVFLCSKGCRRLDRHFEHESMPESVCFCARGLAATSTPTKQRLEWRVFVFKGLPPPGHNFEHESTTSNGVFWCSKPCLHHDAHFEHESTP